jgi:hypothetical protein
VQKELERIRKAHQGVLRAADVVATARDPAHPLHSRFTWDDAEAGEQYRLWQARELIRVTVMLHPASNANTRVYVSLGSDRKKAGGGYRQIDNVLRSNQLRAQLLAQAEADMLRFEAKYKALTELADVLDAMRAARRGKTHAPRQCAAAQA